MIISPLVIKILVWVYGICLIPTMLAIIAWPDAKDGIISREVFEGRLGTFLFFLSVWLISPLILIAMLINLIVPKK